MTEVYKHLRKQKFPALGQYLNIIATLRKTRIKSVEDLLQNIATIPPIQQYPVFRFFTNNIQRRNSTFGRLFNYMQSLNKNDGDGLNKRSEKALTQ